jgi:hypothetical protein
MTATDRSVIDTHWHGYAELRELHDADGQLWNVLAGAGDRKSLFKSVAAQGESACTSARVTAGTVVDVCAGVVTAERCSYVTPQGSTTESACPNNADGHSFKKDAHGEWRCTHCGALM